MRPPYIHLKKKHGLKRPKVAQYCTLKAFFWVDDETPSDPPLLYLELRLQCNTQFTYFIISSFLKATNFCHLFKLQRHVFYKNLGN